MQGMRLPARYAPSGPVPISTKGDGKTNNPRPVNTNDDGGVSRPGGGNNSFGAGDSSLPTFPSDGGSGKRRGPASGRHHAAGAARAVPSRGPVRGDRSQWLPVDPTKLSEFSSIHDRANRNSQSRNGKAGTGGTGGTGGKGGRNGGRGGGYNGDGADGNGGRSGSGANGSGANGSGMGGKSEQGGPGGRGLGGWAGAPTARQKAISDLAAKLPMLTRGCYDKFTETHMLSKDKGVVTISELSMWAMKAELPPFKVFVAEVVGPDVVDKLAPALQLASTGATGAGSYEVTLFELFWNFPGTPYELVFFLFCRSLVLTKLGKKDTGAELMVTAPVALEVVKSLLSKYSASVAQVFLKNVADGFGNIHNIAECGDSFSLYQFLHLLVKSHRLASPLSAGLPTLGEANGSNADLASAVASQADARAAEMAARSVMSESGRGAGFNEDGTCVSCGAPGPDELAEMMAQLSAAMAALAAHGIDINGVKADGADGAIGENGSDGSLKGVAAGMSGDHAVNAAAASVPGVMRLENVSGGHHDCQAVSVAAGATVEDMNKPIKPPEDEEAMQAMIDMLQIRIRMVTKTAEEVPGLRAQLDDAELSAADADALRDQLEALQEALAEAERLKAESEEELARARQELIGAKAHAQQLKDSLNQLEEQIKKDQQLLKALAEEKRNLETSLHDSKLSADARDRLQQAHSSAAIRMAGLEAENARMAIVIQKLELALRDAHFEVREKSDFVASLSHFGSEVPELREKLSAKQRNTVCSVCLGDPAGAVLPPPPPPLASNRTGSGHGSLGKSKVLTTAPAAYLSRGAPAELDLSRLHDPNADDYDPSWVAAEAVVEVVTEEELMVELAGLKEELAEKDEAMAKALADKHSALLRLEKISVKTQRLEDELREVRGEEPIVRAPSATVLSPNSEASIAEAEEELVRLREENAHLKEILGEFESVQGTPSGSPSGTPGRSKGVETRTPRTLALDNNHGPKLVDDPYHSHPSDAVILQGHERTQSGKMVYEIESELKDSIRMLFDSRETIQSQHAQMAGLRRQCSTLHEANTNLKNQMESMLKSQGRVLTRATEVSSTMYLHDLKAFGQLLQGGCEQHGVQLAGTDPSRIKDVTGLLRDALSSKLVHPLQARPAGEQAQIDKLIRVYANVLCATGGSAPNQDASVKLEYYHDLERSLTARAGVPVEAGLGAAFEHLERKVGMLDQKVAELQKGGNDGAE